VGVEVNTSKTQGLADLHTSTLKSVKFNHNKNMFLKHITQSSIPWFQPWDETDVAPGAGPFSLRGGA